MNGFKTQTNHFLNDTTIEGAGSVFKMNACSTSAADFNGPGHVRIQRSENFDGVKGPVTGTRTYPGKAPEKITIAPGDLILAVSHGSNAPSSPSIDTEAALFQLDHVVGVFKQFSK